MGVVYVKSTTERRPVKTLLAVGLLLALASPAHAVEIPKDWRDNHSLCDSDDDGPARDKACAASRKIEKRLYQEGMRHYREGLCYRARPYIEGDGSNSPAAWIWEKGYYAQQAKEHNRRDWSHCHPGSLIDK
jgi:hypothetical protein